MIYTKFSGYRRDGRRLYPFDKGDSPDMGPVYQAAKESADLGREALKWYQEQAAAQQPLIERAANTANEVSLAQLQSMRDQNELAKEYAAYNRSTFRPVEKALVDEAMAFDTAAERERLAGEAGADVAQAFGSQRSQLARQASRAGINPADGAFAAGMTEMGANEALALSQAKNRARTDARTVGRAMKMDAASLGRGLPGQQATSASLAINAGNAAVGNAQVPVGLSTANTQLAGQGYGTAMQGLGQSGNLYMGGARIENDANDNSALWGALGQVGGAAVMKWSDENMKEGVQDVPGEIALSAVRKMPVKGWKYKKGSPGDDGGQRHIGPMAQDVQKAMGDGAAPDGKAVDLISLAGVSLAATKELDKRVTRLERARR